MKYKALAAFAAIKTIALLALWQLAPHFDTTLSKIIHRWDAQWYSRIARDGYGYVAFAADGRQLSDYAFFPLYPLLEKFIQGIFGLTYIYSGVLLSTISSLVAALGIYKVTAHFKSPRIAFYTVVIWAALPIGSVQTLAYSESLFTALAAWSLYFTLKHQWIVAASLAVLAGLTRPIGISVAAAVMVGILVYGRKHRVKPSMIAAFLIAPLGWVGYILWVDSQLPSHKSYFSIADGWGNSVDGGAAFAQWISDFFSEGKVFIGLALLCAVALLIALVIALLRSNAPLPLIIYSSLIVLLALITSGYFGSKPRYLLPVFPLLIPLASWISHHSREKRVFLSGLLVVSSLAYGTLWLTGSGPL